MHRISGGPFTMWLVETDMMANIGQPVFSLVSRVFLTEHERIELQAILDGMPVENRLRGLAPEEILRRLTPEELADGLSEEQAERLRELLQRRQSR